MSYERNNLILYERNIKLMKNITILDTENFTFKTRNSRVVENIFPEKIIHNLQKSNHVLKIGMDR